MGTDGGIWPDAAGLALGFAADAAFGDPRRGHPVAAFGRASTALERRLRADHRAAGVVFAAACVLPTVGAGALASRLTRRQPLARTAVVAAATWATLGARTLRREAEAVAASLAAGDLPAARARLPHLVGRDPRGLDESQIARAVVESVAENTSDAVVAPLLWGALAGLPGLLGYRAVNTLDAMVGHRSRRDIRFGWASARADDCANWLPARLTGLLAAGCAGMGLGSPRAAWRALRRDGGRHPSPNAGRCEAAFAGALGLRLGGANAYGERVEVRPHLGDGRAPSGPDIARAVRLAGRVNLAATLCCVGAATLTRAARRRRR